MMRCAKREPTAREMLIAAAAEQWNVQPLGLPGRERNGSSQSLPVARLTYGELAPLRCSPEGRRTIPDSRIRRTSVSLASVSGESMARPSSRASQCTGLTFVFLACCMP